MRRHFSWLSTRVLVGSLGILAVACTPETTTPGEQNTPSTGSKSRNLPCDVKEIVDKHCSLCHGKEPISGAPMSLVTQADFQAKSDDGDSYYKLALERIHAEKPADLMPPVSQDGMSEDELSTLNDWLDDGAPKSTASCSGDDGDGDSDDDDTDDNTGDGDDGDDVAGDGDTGDGDTGDGDTTTPPDNAELEIFYDEIKPEDCEKSIELRAFNPNSPNEGFAVGQNVTDTYECFDFEVPYDGKMQALQIEPIIDDARVVHHWLVYDAEGTKTGKSYWNCTGQHPAAQLLAGWAAGRGATTMPRGVGLKLPQKATSKFTLEIHYNNAGRAANVKDRSGAKICATSKLKENEAAVHWLGTEAIFGFSAQGTCHVPKNATILSSWPHMHAAGTHMKIELERGGKKTVIHDKPFSFDEQRAYDTPLRVGKGDVIVTSCDYDAPSRFGTETSSEMCYNYVLAYPAGALANGVSLTGTSGTCLQ